MLRRVADGGEPSDRDAMLIKIDWTKMVPAVIMFKIYSTNLISLNIVSAMVRCLKLSTQLGIVG